MRCLPLLLVLATAAPIATAHADAPGETQPMEDAPAPVVETHYGPQLLLADVAVVGGSALLLTANRNGPSEGQGLIAAAGISAYLLVAPAIHLAHGDGRGAAVSLGLRVGLPMVLSALGEAIGPRSTTTCIGGGGCATQDTRSSSGFLVGTALGLVAATVLDATYNSTHREAAAPRLSPSFGYAAGNVTVGVGGAF
jgi:hypothetical protein